MNIAATGDFFKPVAYYIMYISDDTDVSTFCAFPGVSFTNHVKSQRWYSFLPSRMLLYPLYFMFMRSAHHGVQVLNYCALKPELTDRTSEDFSIFHGYITPESIFTDPTI